MISLKHLLTVHDGSLRLNCPFSSPSWFDWLLAVSWVSTTVLFLPLWHAIPSLNSKDTQVLWSTQAAWSIGFAGLWDSLVLSYHFAVLDQWANDGSLNLSAIDYSLNSFYLH